MSTCPLTMHRECERSDCGFWVNEERVGRYTTGCALVVIAEGLFNKEN